MATNKKIYLNNKQLEALNENFELEVDADEINLSSFKKKDELNPKIWIDNDTLNPRVRMRLLDIADTFWDSLDITWVKPKDIILTGSICNYNWSKYSDIDLHIVVDYKQIGDRQDFIEEYFNTKKNEWNNEHSLLKIYGFPLEIYVQDSNETHSSSGIYSLERNHWLVKPRPSSVKPIQLDKYKIKEKSADIMTLIDDLVDKYNSTDDAHEIEEIGNKASKLLKHIKKLRNVGLEMNGESDWRNIVYKVLRRSEYLDKLYDIKIRTYDKINSLR